LAKVLVIDDDRTVRFAICRGLKISGHESREAGDGKSGVDLAKQWQPDLVISDINMPEQEGIQTISELRQSFPHLPIIVISGEREVGNYAPLNDARQLGADAAIPKPFELALLLGEVERLLKRGASEVPGSPGS
jgi:DNA-binding response OmpR family regulator